MKVKFLKSAVDESGYPFPYKPEVAIVGRSNAGKSSFINSLTGQKIAKVSQTPGKTRLLNFFELNEAIYLVDMPGYGFATGDRKEVESWRKMIEKYLLSRETLKGVLLILDIRRDWSEDESNLKNWLDHHNIPLAVLMNKADKLSRSQILTQQKKIAEKLGDVETFVLSSLKKQGFEDVKNLIFKDWAR